MAKLLLAGILLAVASAAADSLPPYTNHTVGGSAGWLFDAATNSSSANFSHWAANQTFNLGDFLIFNTNPNQTVIQTYNETTYLSCSTDDDFGNLTSVYTAGVGIETSVTLAVPLTIKGKNYYFSDADDGIQCEQGLRFAIDVAQGRGLPPSLNQPPPPPYAEPPSDSTSPTPITNQGETFHNGAGLGKVVRTRLAVWIFLFSNFGFLLF